MTLSRLRQLGWASLLLGCTALFAALWVQVNSVKSEVRMAEREIVRLQIEKQALEMEFQTRANQAQLASWNAVDFGYLPPAASQFLIGEQALAAFGVPRAAGAPEPIRVAQNDASATEPDFPVSVRSDDSDGQGDTARRQGPAGIPQSATRIDLSQVATVRVPMKATIP